MKPFPRRLALAIPLLALLVSAGPAAASDPTTVTVTQRDTRQIGGEPGGSPPVASASRTRTITPCTWSYFGDPRSVAYRNWISTGCIGIDGKAKLDQYNLQTGEHRLLTLFRNLEVDDHNNPSLDLLPQEDVRVRLAPRGLHLSARPQPVHGATACRCATTATGVQWRGSKRIPLGQGCGLGYTYPNPVKSGNRMYLFMRGPCWYPYFTSTKDGKTWARPKTLVLGPPSSGRNVRPYAKYDTAPDGSILMTFSDGHPGSYKNNLYYMRFKAGRFYKADGSLIGTTSRACPSGSASSTWCRSTRRARAGLADGHRLERGRRRRRSSTPAGSATTTCSATPAGTARGGSRARSRRPAATCSATATAASRSTTPIRAGSC